MPMAAATRTAVRGLSNDDLQSIRGTLAAGRKPRVMFTEAAGQVAGQLGQVVELIDPATSDEWLVVRFGRDELPFSPADLSIPPRGAASRRSTPKSSPPPPAPEPKITPRAVPAPREETTVTTVQTSPAPSKNSSAAKAPVAGKSTPATGSAGSTPSPAPTPPAAPAPPAKAARRPPKPKSPASLTVTLAYSDGEWTVGATQGSKALAKPYVIKPAEALKMVGLLDVPGVHEAVEHIVAAERAEAEAQAQKLRPSPPRAGCPAPVA
jgi:hypothetical protein